MKQVRYYDFPIGTLGIAVEHDAITQITFGMAAVPEGEELPLHRRAFLELSEYFAGKRQTFSLPLAPEGTAFQKRVWQALCAIPFGQVRTYADIAKQVGSPKGFRAVGSANHHNPIPILIPCHRVIGRNHTLTGYAGGLDVKAALLELEGVSVQNNHVTC